MKKIVKYLVLLIVISTIFCIQVKVHAEETKYETDYAVDIFGKSIDDGIGRFVCKTTDEEASKYDPQYISNQYWIFEYGRKESEINNNGNYVIVNYLKLPYFIQKDIETENICFGIQKGIWTESKYLEEEKKINCEAYLTCINSKIESPIGISNLYSQQILMYLNFIDYPVDEIVKIHVKINLYRHGGLFWSTWKKVVFEKTITSDSIVINKIDGEGDILDLTHIVSIAKSVWKNGYIEKLEKPYFVDDKTYEHKINFYYNPSVVKQNLLYFGKSNNRTTNLEIIDMYYIRYGYLYYSDNINVETLLSDKYTDVNNPTWLESIINFLKTIFKKASKSLWPFFVIILVFFLLFFSNKNKVVIVEEQNKKKNK